MRKHMNQFFSTVSNGMRVSHIGTRLVISFFILSLVPILIIGMIAYNKSNKAITEKIATYSEENMRQVAINIQTLASKYEQFLNDISVDEDFQTNIKKLYDENPLERAKSRTFLESYMKLKMLGFSNPVFEIYCTDIERVNIKDMTPLSYVSEKDYLSIIEKTKNSSDSIWTLISDGKGNYNLLLSDKIVNINNGKFLGVTSIVIPTAFFSGIFEDMNIGVGTKVFMTDFQGVVIASREPDIVTGQAYEPVSMIEKFKTEKGSFIFDIKNKPHLIASSPISGNDWRIVSTIPFAYLNSESEGIKTTILFIGVICLIIAVIVSLLITESISYPLKKLVGLMSEAKSGNLAITLKDKKKDEIGEVISHFNSMVLNFRELLTKVRVSSDKVLTESDQLASYASELNTTSGNVNQMMEQVALGAQDQAIGVNNSVARMNHLANKIKNVEDNIVTISDVVGGTQKLSGEAMESVSFLNDRAVQTRKASMKIAENINDLYTHMKEIKSVLKVISDISEQTHLLALNAAIEAARAGASGLGFGVVANEIKKLADQSSASSKIIHSIIITIQMKADIAVEATRSAEKTIDEQMLAVNKTDESFRLIYSSMERLVSYIEDISSNIQQVIDDRNTTLESMENISAVIEQSAATTQQISAATHKQMEKADSVSTLSKSLEDMAIQLMNSVSLFMIK